MDVDVAQERSTGARPGARPRTPRLAVVLVAGLLAVAAACSSSTGDAGPGRGTTPGTAGDANPNLQLAAALQPFGACDELLGYVKGAALERVGPYGLQDQSPDVATAEGGVPTKRSAPSAPATTPSAAPGAPSAGSSDSTSSSGAEPAPTTQAPAADAGDATHSDTNVQEKGVDEPDVVKTDGRRILTLTGGRLVAVDVTGPAPRNAGALDLPRGAAGQILMSGDHVLVISAGASTVDPVAERSAPVRAGTELTLVDIAHPEAMKVLNTVRIDGQYVSARMVDGQARVVTTSSPSRLAFVNPSSSSALAQQAAEDANRRIVEASRIEDWLPAVHIGDGSNPTTRPLLDCSKVSHPKTFSGFSVLSVLSVDVTASAVDPADAVGVMADGQTVYASKANLYVATPAYVDVPRNPSGSQGTGTVPTTRAPAPIALRDATSIHKFSIEARGPAVYRASGEVDGSILNQYSMSEDAGALRVATTTSPAGNRGCVRCPGSESFVRVLREADGALQQVGQVGNLGRGEQIKAVRFVGTQGYVVTFRQTDPLYTLDLRDPTAPRVVGELALLGYSAYLHPAADGLLIGIGQDATAQGRALGTKVSLFDVADPANPRELQKYVLWNSTSEVEQDFHAFLYWEPAKLAMIPVTRAYVGFVGGACPTSPTAGVCAPRPYLPPFTGALGLTLDRAAITERGRVVNPAPVGRYPGCDDAGTTGVRDGGCEAPCPPDVMCAGVPTASDSRSGSTGSPGTAPTSAPRKAPDPVDCAVNACAPVPAPTSSTTTSTNPAGPTAPPTTIACPPDATCTVEPVSPTCPPVPAGSSDTAIPCRPVPAGAPIERSIIVGDTVFTLSSNGIKSSALDDLHEKYWLPFS